VGFRIYFIAVIRLVAFQKDTEYESCSRYGLDEFDDVPVRGNV
jgi:hypothetical protein